MKIGKEFLENQFEGIIDTYGFRWEELEDGGGVLTNGNINMSFWAERYQEGVATNLRNINEKEDYFIFDLFEAKGIKNELDYLTTDEVVYSESLTGNQYVVYIVRVFLERYCQDVLSGDFSQVGPGEPD